MGKRSKLLLTSSTMNQVVFIKIYKNLENFYSRCVLNVPSVIHNYKVFDLIIVTFDLYIAIEIKNF
ncbi:hypothetical protein [Trichoplusia ni single nucleopolyhedrovirus]|uniref:Uncharacterized protein n=1 Tax=Trichoplusia ni single nucleopolyhedrovirus TaxID=332054 RepID=Q461S8_9ABAC|nr:hypothetical protein TNSV_gp138 [Trichoplusia ni single nucleopolyhedrovirus]AAZ67508.1 hypothetical protein [Trichoplusia ni single nucleopolyhedrovirus]